jgi:hypothetical protein
MHAGVSGMKNTVVRLEKALSGGYPLVYVRSGEEARLERLLAGLARHHLGADAPLVSWSLTRGFVANGSVVAPVCDPLEALRHILAEGQARFWLLKDLPLLFDGRPELLRALRDLCRERAGRAGCVFVSCAQVNVPQSLRHEIFMAELGPPEEDEIAAELAQVMSGVADAVPGEAWLARVAGAMKGLSGPEVHHLALRLVAERILELDAALAEVRAEKSAALMQEACLKFIPQTVDIARVGGLENLKEWVLNRRAFFGGDAAPAAGVPLPAGVLFMGVSGCGKSMAAKVIASAWELPLVRLDMNLVLSGAHGAPEYAFDHALRVAEQIAPMVLWIDEMENSFGYDSDLRSGNNPNIFSSFLTWMQEKPAGVFVVATANRIEKLPAEVIRKGRFDQLFFLDLPTEEERTRILEIHLAAAGAEPAAFNLKTLAVVTKGWSGAEIEQGIRAAVVHAWQEGRAFNERDVLWSSSRLVPLSRTMAEQIKQLRIWSQDRATPASAKGTP